MIKWMIRKYNRVVEDIKAELPDKPVWLVQIRLIDNSDIGLEYKAYSKLEVKKLYDMDIRVYNGLIVGSGAGKKYIKKKDIFRVMDIVLVDSSVADSTDSEDEGEDIE